MLAAAGLVTEATDAAALSRSPTCACGRPASTATPTR